MRKILILLFLPFTLLAQQKTVQGELRVDVGEDVSVNVGSQVNANLGTSSNNTGRVADLESDVATLQTDIATLTASLGFDSIVINETRDTVFGYMSLDLGQVVVPWVVGDNTAPLSDDIPPSASSAVIENSDKDLIILTMSETLLDSIVEYSGAAGGVWDGLDVSYNFNELAGNLLDLVGGNDGTVTGASYSVSGISGTAFDFVAANDDYVELTTGVNHGSTDFTVAAWIYPDVNSGVNQCIYCDNTNNSANFLIENDGSLMLLVRGGNHASSDTIDITTDGWQFVAVSYDQTANVVHFYRNGVWDHESFSDTFSEETKYIGGATTIYSYDGRIDNWFKWDTEMALASTIDSLYNSGSPREYNESGGEHSSQVDSMRTALTVTKNAVAQTIDTLKVVGRTLEIDLAAHGDFQDTFLISYSKPDTYGMRDTASNYTADFSDFAVTNNIREVSDTIQIFKTYNFNSIPVGTYTTSEMTTYLGTMVVAEGTWKVASDTIAGVISNALKFTQPAGERYQSGRGSLNLDSNYTKVCVSWYFWQDPDACSMDETKGPGLSTHKDWRDRYNPDPARRYDPTGLLATTNRRYGGTTSYHYDYTYSWNPWSDDLVSGDYKYSRPITNGTIHKFDVCAQMNTFTNGVGNYDGTYELAIDDVIVLQEPTAGNSGILYAAEEDTSNLIGALRIATYVASLDGNGTGPTREFDNYFDNAVIYWPVNDDPGTGNLHTSMWDSPNSITGIELYYDQSVTSAAVTIEAPTGSHANYAWRIDAGANKTVTLNFVSGGTGGALGNADYMYVYDGKDLADDVLYVETNKQMSNTMGGDGIVTSSGRYMTVYFTSDVYNGSNFYGELTFNP